MTAEAIPRGHYRFRHAARMEWIKLRTLRSVKWALLVAVAGMTGIGIAAGHNTINARGDVTNNILAGGALGSLVFAVLGVLVMTSEYSSGTIRATLAAIPRRPLVLAAKTAVFGVVALPTLPKHRSFLLAKRAFSFIYASSHDRPTKAAART